MTEEEMRVCPGCGRQEPVVYNVCPYCGRPAYPSPYGPPQAPYGPQPYWQPYPPQPQEPLGVVKYILYLLSLSVVLGIIIYILWYNNPDPERRHVARNCLIIGFAWIVIVVMISIIAAFILLAV
jgi:hypothetical protein